MRKLLSLLIFSALPLTLFAQDYKSASTNEWQQLFNGKDLEGWEIKIRGYGLGENFGNTFRVDDGLLKVSYDEYNGFGEKYGHMFYKQKYSYYVLRSEYRFVGDQVSEGPDWAYRNNGFMVHSQSAESMLIDQDFPISIEAQLLGGNGVDDRPNLNLCSPGTHVVMNGELFTPHCVNSSSKTFHGDEWVQIEILVLGDEKIIHMIEGDTVLVYDKPQIGGGSVDNYDEAIKQDGQLLKEGYIAIQSESHPTEFRKIEVLNLVGCMDPKAKNYRTFIVKEDNSLCEY